MTLAIHAGIPQRPKRITITTQVATFDSYNGAAKERAKRERRERAGGLVRYEVACNIWGRKWKVLRHAPEGR